MPFIWRQKSADTPSAPLHGEALACMDAGYVLVDSKGATTVSFNLHTLFGLGAPVQVVEELQAALKAESYSRLIATLDALKSGHVTAPVHLFHADGAKVLLVRSAVVPSDTGMRAGVAWLYDISGEFRKQDRAAQEGEKLKSDIKQYSTILNMAPFPIWQRDADLKIRYYNLAYSEVAEASDTDGDETPELDRRARALAQSALAAGEPKKERRHIVVNGERKLFEIQELPIPQEKMLVGFAHDITDSEALAEELERHVSAQDDLLESASSAMAVYGADMRLKSFNYAFANLWKLDEAWLESHPNYGEILEALREKRRLPEQANFVHFKQQQLKLFTDLIAPQEEFFYLPDGKALRVIAIPHALGGIMFAYEDVTDRLALERSYNTLIAVQRETLDHLHEGVAVFGEDGRLKLSNPVYLTMWGFDETLARAEPHISELIDRVRPLYSYEDWDAFRQEQVAQIQSRTMAKQRIERKDGTVIDCTTVPLPDGATLISYLDVTDSTLVERSLRERNEALQEADKLKSEFLANVSYELRSPLTSISGFAEMLKQEYFGGLSEKQKEYIDGIHQSSQHLMQLVNDILDLASIEAGYMQLQVTRFDIHDMMASVLPLVQERIKEHDIAIALECPQKIGKLLADETRIRQIMFKLLSNAIKFSPPGTTITFGASETPDGEVALWVSDQGYGIPLEEQAAVFDKFYKGRGSEIPKSAMRSGTGLGLSIVNHFVDLHGGKIVLESDTTHGTTIRCIFPRENPGLTQYMQAKPARRRKSAPGAA